MWGRAVREREGAARYRFGFWLAGLWAGSMAGPNGSPAAFFLFSFSFLFSDFRILSYILQIGFNQFKQNPKMF
jgi:hypothetical protein